MSQYAIERHTRSGVEVIATFTGSRAEARRHARSIDVENGVAVERFTTPLQHRAIEAINLPAGGRRARKTDKRIARRRRIVRLTNLGQPFGHAARLIQAQAAEERGLLWRALAWIGGHFSDLAPSAPRNEGPRKPGQKDWE